MTADASYPGCRMLTIKCVRVVPCRDARTTYAGPATPCVTKGRDFILPCVTRGAPVADAETDLLRSSLDLLILTALSWAPMHGYAISEWIDDATRSVLLVEEGTLYPALHRLERRGWIAAEWGVSENNRKAKFYSMTPDGRARLRAESRVCQRNADAIATVLRRTSSDAS